MEEIMRVTGARGEYAHMTTMFAVSAMALLRLVLETVVYIETSKTRVY